MTGTPKMKSALTGFNNKFDGRPLLSFNADLGEGGDYNQVNAVGGHKTAGDSDSLDGLIDRTRSNSLHFRGPLFTHDRSEGSSNRFWFGLSGYLENIHVASLSRSQIEARLKRGVRRIRNLLLPVKS